MSGEPKMFRIDPDNHESESIEEVEFARLGFQERRDIQEWVASNPGILGDGLLIIGKEFSGFDRTNERLDLLAVDWDGKLVIIELKRDDTGADAHWQAIKYASYLRHSTAADIVRMLATYAGTTEPEAANSLRQHINADDLNTLNHDQRIILASHRFAPEVTSAVLWLNAKAPEEDLITCVRLTPYHDRQRDSLYVQASTIIPLPGADEYMIKVGDRVLGDSEAGDNSFGEKLSRSFQRNLGDEVTPFLRRVGGLSIDGLAEEIKPDRWSRWGAGGPEMRYYHLWYSSPPWSNWGMSYRINLFPQAELGVWWADVEFKHHSADVVSNLMGVHLSDNQVIDAEGIKVGVGQDLLNDGFGERIAATVRGFVEAITPIINDLDNRDGDGD